MKMGVGVSWAAMVMTGLGIMPGWGQQATCSSEVLLAQAQACLAADAGSVFNDTKTQV